MADKTTTTLTAAGPLDGSELVPIVQGGNSRKATVADIRGGSPLSSPQITDFSIALNSPVANETATSLRISGAADASLLRGYLNLIPAGDFSVVVKLEAILGVDFNGAGILFRDTTGRYITCGPLSVAGGWVEIGQWSDQTTFASGVAPFDLNAARLPTWYKADFVASTNDVTMSFSYDGTNWLQNPGTSTYLGTCDAVGVCISHRTAAYQPYVWFEHYEIL